MQERLGVWTCCLGVLECSLEEACRLHRVPALAVLRCRQGMAGKLREAAARGNTKEVLQLLEEGAKVTPDEHGRNALHLAASAGHPDVVAALLLAGTDVNITDSAGCTALQRAAADGHLEVVRQLVQHGADVNHQDIVHGNTALHEASWKGFSRCVAALCKAKANLHLKNCGGFAALHLCCQNGHNQSCRELLLAGCSPNLQNNYGDTPLHTSARYGHAGVTRILISANCRVSDQNKNGDTALHIAAAMGRRKLTRILLEAGCDKALKNKQNETAQDIATRKDLNEILVLLKSPTATHVANARARSQSKAQGQGQSQVQGTSQGRSDKNDKKREKNESGTSSKDSSTRHKDKKKHKNGHKVHFEKPVGRHWSPYGCHYYPDPRAFPQPNLDSLPREPLKKGEQYYLDLAGNIRKGPVGVGYTCYCAPFFRHMEARLDRDKQELKEHIDMAHQRLDQKVSSLERRTQGRLAELTRCVVAERTLCDRRHQHLTQWLTRGGMGRSSERARCPEDMVPVVPRARSLELLLDERGDEHDIGAMAVVSNGRDHNRSFDALLDRGVGVVPLRGHPHRRSANDFPVPKTNIDHNRSFDTLLDARQDHQHHYRSANELPVTHMHDANHDYPRSPGPHNRSFDVLLERPPRRGQSQKKVPVTDDIEDRMMGRISVSPNTCQDGNMSDEEQPSDWRGQPLRRSVQEMVARFQSAQAQHAPPPWASQSQGTRRRLEPDARSQRQDDNSSESSEGEGDDDVNQRLPAAPDYENISACPWRPEESRLVSGLPYRSRSAVYSPTHDTDVHNDSGYSTKLYGSSKGPSPSLSGQLECEGILPSQRAMYNAHTGHSGQRKRYDHGDDPGASNIVAASLV